MLVSEKGLCRVHTEERAALGSHNLMSSISCDEPPSLVPCSDYTWLWRNKANFDTCVFVFWNRPCAQGTHWSCACRCALTWLSTGSAPRFTLHKAMKNKSTILSAYPRRLGGLTGIGFIAKVILSIKDRKIGAWATDSVNKYVHFPEQKGTPLILLS